MTTTFLGKGLPMRWDSQTLQPQLKVFVILSDPEHREGESKDLHC